ncbi:cilia- and flagella-associated protein 58-like isoform X2 [Physella acuta]|uniref:cilia- and flagella-associated protein 58-like isoform X1 n=1 Tax=Physella acuta TaxID=109671 RepID=UPI0027DCC3DD|nr:cilia- and flagella-associated protein 58-like isoform X1 [Physella acuta]XP_059175376.1 cilia- and flagella-associated protein 58-like isoform X1 [Physella acuta]XP_059175386.1 cilia- and flagella-associated protein 58-like isoform X2 [Physella acuta]
MTEEKKDKEKAPFDDSAFDALEKDFQEVLAELAGDRSLEKFRLEYEKLHKALKKSHESERRLMQKCRELNAEIVANSAKVVTALKLSQDDQATIASLKKEVEKAWKMVDAAHEKEAKSKETAQRLKTEIEQLSKLVEQGAGLTMGQEHSVNELLKLKEDLTKERDEQLQEITRLRENLADAHTRQQKLETDKADAEEKIMQLNTDIQMRNNEAQREARKRDKLERDLTQAKAELDAKNSDIKKMVTQIEHYKEEKEILDQQLKEQRVLSERTLKDSEVLNARLMKLSAEYESQLINADSLAQENQSKATDLKQKEEELSMLKSESQRQNKMRETLQRKLRTVEDSKTEVEQQKETLKSQISALERELELAKKKTEADKKSIDDLIRERDILNKNLLKAAGATQKQLHLVKLHDQSKKNLEQEIANYKDEAQKQRKIIYQLEKERDRYINEASDLTQKVLQHMEDVKVREMQIFDYKKKIAEAETKLKQQQNLYEAVRSDRNLYSKNLIESQDEITEMRRKLRIMSHQIDQLKEEIQAKEAALVKETLVNQQVEKEKDTLKAELQKMKQQALESKSHIEAQEAEEKKLLAIIREADAERVRQKKELDQVISERDILGTQLVRRNDELALLYEKIKIQQSVLNKGEIQYNQRLEDIRILKLEIKKMRREKVILQKSVANVEDLRREVYHIQRELLRERTRCKALEEELENPMNIHRWRKLEGSDPATFEMIQKIQTLQKRLIQKTEEVVEKELLIQEKEKLYLELKHILARQPGPEVAEQLAIYQQTLKEKTKQMKGMASELNMYEAQVAEYKYEIERIARELQEVKKKYFMQKKKEQQQKERERAMLQAEGPAIISQRTDAPRFTGGGFNLKTTKSAA